MNIGRNYKLYALGVKIPEVYSSVISDVKGFLTSLVRTGEKYNLHFYVDPDNLLFGEYKDYTNTFSYYIHPFLEVMRVKYNMDYTQTEKLFSLMVGVILKSPNVECVSLGALSKNFDHFVKILEEKERIFLRIN